MGGTGYAGVGGHAAANTGGGGGGATLNGQTTQWGVSGGNGGSGFVRIWWFE